MDEKINKDESPHFTQDWSIHARLKLKQPNNHQPCYGFQRGNIVFTAQPPQRQDSGLGSSSRGSACDNNFTVTPQCEICCGIRSPMSARRAQNFTAHFCTNVSQKKHLETVDVSSQTSPSSSMVFTKENKKIILKNRKYELDKNKKRHARTVHIDVYCTESSDSDDTILTPNSSDTLLDLSDIKINSKKISKKSQRAISKSRRSNNSLLHRSPCLSTISSKNTISRSSFFESSSCGLSSFIDSTTLENSSTTNSESESIQEKFITKNYVDTTSSSDEECSETAWSFTSINSQKYEILARRPWRVTKNEDLGSFSDCSQSPMYRKKPTSSNNTITQVAKMASKFGPTKSMVKQDHHVGPSKNPDCLCFNCRRYFNNRHRSLSFGNEVDQPGILSMFKNCL